jgi:hypothetical protein
MGECTEIIVLTKIFQDEINSGYTDLTFSVIAEVCFFVQSIDKSKRVCLVFVFVCVFSVCVCV